MNTPSATSRAGDARVRPDPPVRAPPPLTIALAGVRSIGDIIGPVFLALVITVTLHPIRLWLERRPLPAWAVSIVVMLLAAYLVLFLLTLALIVSVAQAGGAASPSTPTR